MKTLIRRMYGISGLSERMGWGNGYVALPPGHRFYRVHYTEIPVSVHGGLTFAQMYTRGGFADGFEWPEDWEGHWIVGFDCAHFNDTPETCPREFVEAETLRLADQLMLENWADAEHYEN